MIATPIFFQKSDLIDIKKIVHLERAVRTYDGPRYEVVFYCTRYNSGPLFVDVALGFVLQSLHESWSAMQQKVDSWNRVLILKEHSVPKACNAYVPHADLSWLAAF